MWLKEVVKGFFGRAVIKYEKTIHYHAGVYFCGVRSVLDNPVYHALISGDVHLGTGTEKVKYFEKEVSPFAGFESGYSRGFEDLYDMIPADRLILHATRNEIETPKGWKLIAHIPGTQFLFINKHESAPKANGSEILPLKVEHVDQMIALARLTKPGPFDRRTIEFGKYHGIFEGTQLVSMTGQRLHVFAHTEVSAVCTHPDHLGKGYAGMLLHHQLDLILNDGQKPFLHVRSDNARAIALYERIGFKANGSMNFYFLKKSVEPNN